MFLYINYQVRDFIERSASVCQPSAIHICDGSELENLYILKTLQVPIFFSCKQFSLILEERVCLSIFRSFTAKFRF